jgi:hypothetical protein
MDCIVGKFTSYAVASAKMSEVVESRRGWRMYLNIEVDISNAEHHVMAWQQHLHVGADVRRQ